MAGLKKKVIKGLLWVSGGSFLTQFINFIIKIFLARLLFPSDFGLFAMAFIVIGFLSLFTGFGIGSAIIYRKDRIDKVLNAAFFIAPVIGIVFYMFGFLLSGAVASFFNQPLLSPMIKLIAISFIIDSFIVVPHSLLSKKLYFRKRSLADSLPILVYGCIAVFLAYSGFGVWSLVFSHLAQHIVWVSLLWYFCPWKPQLIFDWKIAKEILHFGKYVFSAAFLAFLINYIDKTIIGKQLGDESLGYYSFAFNIAALPIVGFTHFVSSVFHPIYSKLQDNKEKLRDAYIISLKWVVLFTLPISGGLLILADIFTIVVFGEKWFPMIVILQIFSIYPVLRSISSLSSYFLEATGYPKKATMIAFLQFIFLAAIIVPALLYYDSKGIALSIILSWILATPLFMHAVARLTDVKLKYYIKILGKPFLSAIIMAFVVYFVKVNFLSSKTILNLITLVVLGVLVYGVFSFLLDKKLMGEIRDIFKQLS